MARRTAQVQQSLLVLDSGSGQRIVLGSPEWWNWLQAPGTTAFRYAHPVGGFTARREHRNGSLYWYAYAKRAGRLCKSYLGRSDDLTTARLDAAARTLADRSPTPAPPRDASGAHRTALPPQPTRLIGREHEVSGVAELLHRPDVRLVTLTGSGGTGKSRVALAAAARLLDRLADGLAFVDLSPIADPGLVAPTIARALALSTAGRLAAQDRLVEHLRNRQLLLVLDNCEQVVDGAPLVAELLAACPALRVLATSREPLRLHWEYLFPVPPLAVPAQPSAMGLAEVAGYPAVTLFVERARAVDPSFSLTEENAPLLAEICARLDGLPLAIELAAARVRALTPATLLARLGSCLDLLAGDTRDRPPRHRTLRAAISWSYELLSPELQTLFRRLGVFVGGCSPEAAEAICETTLDNLTALVDRHLLQHEPQRDGGSHFRLLETIREYALERLAASDEWEAMQERHASYFLALAEQSVGPEVPRLEAHLDMVDRELDNFRAVLRWSVAGSGEGTRRIEVGLRLASALEDYWAPRGGHREGRQWLSVLLARVPRASLPRARALSAAGYLALRQGEYTEATALLEESLTVARQLAAECLIPRVLRYLGMAAHGQGDRHRAIALYEEARARLHESGKLLETAILLRNLADLQYERGDLGQAGLLYEESQALARTVGDPHGVAYTLRGLAHVARAQGDLTGAAERYRESLRLLQRLQDRRCLPFCLEGLACTASQAGDAEGAARLFGAAEALRHAIGVATPPAEQADHQRGVAAARALLDERRFAAAWQEGAAMELDQAVRYALVPMLAPLRHARLRGSPETAPPRPPLSAREREVAALVARGCTNRQIASELVIAPGTAGRHVSNILAKLGFHSRAQVAAWAAEHGLAAHGAE